MYTHITSISGPQIAQHSILLKFYSKHMAQTTPSEYGGVLHVSMFCLPFLALALHLSLSFLTFEA